MLYEATVTPAGPDLMWPASLSRRAWKKLGPASEGRALSGNAVCPSSCPRTEQQVTDISHPQEMGGARQAADSAKQEVGRALADGKRKADSAPPRAIHGPNAVLALQRYAGNQAVSALMAAKLRSPAEQQGAEIDTA